VDGTETKFGIYVYNDTASDWDDLGSQGNLTSTSFTTVEFNLTSDHRISSGNVRIRFIGRNETSDSVNSTLNIEYHRIRVTNAYTPLSGENSGNMFGWSVGNASDINADGSYDDVIIGAPNYRDEPYSYTWGSSDTKVEQISNSEANNYPAIAIDSNDNSIICWADSRDHATYDGIYAQKLNSQGVAQWGSSDVKVNQSSTNSIQPFPAIAVDSNGNSVIAWVDDRDGNYNIYAQKLDSSGNAQWGSSDVKVNQNSDSALQNYPSVVIDSNDDAIVVWHDERNGASDDDIYAQKLNSTGVAQWGSSDVKVNQNSDSTIQSYPDVALYSDDSVIVTWSDYRSSSHYDIYVQKVSPTGSVLWGSTDIKVNQNSDSADQTVPTVAVDSDGYAVVAWTDDRNGITDDDIYAQRLDARGSALWGSSDVKVNQISNGDYHFYQDIAIDSEGNAFITWYNSTGIAYYGIHAQKIDTEGYAVWGSSDLQVNQNETNFRYLPCIAIDSDDNVIVAWSDSRSGGTDYDVYAQKFNRTNITGKAYIFNGGSPFDTTADVSLIGENEGDNFGYSVHYAGDLDSDGKPDVIVGIPYWDNGATTDCGQILVYRGGSSMDTTADYVHNGTQANEHFGWSVSFSLTFNGSTNATVIAGAPHRDGSTDTGRIEVLYISDSIMIPEYQTIMIPVMCVIFLYVQTKRKRGEITKKIHLKSMKIFKLKL
jgi:hypothetical protein